MKRFVMLGGVLAVAAAHTATGQLSAGISSSAHSTFIAPAGWQRSAQISSALRFDLPGLGMTFDQIFEQRGGSPTLMTGALTATLASPAFSGFRAVAYSSVSRDRTNGIGQDNRLMTGAVSYRRQSNGAWAGVSAQRFSTPSIVTGSWRQLSSTALVSIQSTLRSGVFGSRPATVQTIQYQDSVRSDSSSGWTYFPRFRTFGDSGQAGRRQSWSETEARLGWSIGRLSLDGVVGYRPRIDSVTHAAWFQGFATVAIARSVALSAGGGTVTQPLPFARSSGRFGMIALRLAPAALLRPAQPAPITPSPSALSVRRNEAGEYVVSVRVPRARAVELSGDFNGWRPIRLEQARGDIWEATLPIGPGAYRMNLRVDGERWVAPPGTAAIDDEFNGQVGLVIVR